MELGDTILSTEQYTPNKTKQKNKKNVVTTPPPTNPIEAPTKYTKVIPSKPEIEPVVYPTKSEALQIPYPKMIEEVPIIPLNTDSDDPDMPALEFLDVEEELRDIAAASFDERSPFIPGPFSDFDLKNRNICDLLSDIDESELINRAPYIPPPCIDKIISFNDLPLPDLDDSYQDLSIFNQQQEEVAGSTAPFMDANSLDSNQLYDVGSAKVPAHLLKRLFPGVNGKSDGI